VGYCANAQSPNKMSYQLIARDLSGTIQTNTTLGFRLSIVQGSPTGSIAYQETFSKTTNGFGLINHQIGTGFTTQGSFSGINWSQGPYFIKTEIDFNNGIAYQDLGLSQLLSVPYAKYADVAGSGVNGGVSLDNDTTNEIQLLSIANDTLFLTKGGYVLLPSSTGTSLDNDSTNELQLLTLVGSTISLSQNGGSITIFDGNYSSLTGAPTLLSSFTNDVGYLTTEVDASVTNEIQTLSLTNDTLSLTNGGGSVYISSGGAGTSLDNDSTNELQTISKTGSTVTLSNNGGSVTVFDGDYTNLTNQPAIPTLTSDLTNDSGFLTSEIDGDNSNELQTISKTGSTVTLSNNGGSVTVFDGDYTNLTNQPAIPTLTSDLTNDSGFLTSEIDGDNSNELQTISKTGSTITLSDNGGSVTVFDGDYTNLTNQPAIPTLTSDLTNDSGFLTSEVDGSVTNEIQTLSQIGDTIKLSDGGYVLVSTSLGSGATDHIDGLRDARNDSVNGNLGLGVDALDSHTSGSNNIAIGNGVGKNLQEGDHNILIGAMRGSRQNWKAYENVAIGFGTGENLDSSANYNVFVGHLSGNMNSVASSNVAVGHGSLQMNKTSNGNVAVGANALQSATKGNNTAVGFYSLKFNTTGQSNVGLGFESLLNNSTGNSNVGLGQDALRANTTGYDNIAVGHGAMYLNTIGYYNIAIGREALHSNTNASGNIAIGRFSMWTNTAGGNNIGIGQESLYKNSTGSSNTAIGVASMTNNTTGASNTSIGYRSMHSSTTASDNAAFGYSTLENNTTGHSNVAVGFESMKTNTTGNRNVANGFYSLKSNTSGGENVSIGGYTLTSNTTGGSNVAVGDFALHSNTTGSMNVGIGKSALQSNTTASGNVGIGRFALISTTTGNSNVAIGIETMSQNRTGVANAALGQSALQFARGSQNTAIGGEALKELRGGDFNVGLGRGSGDNFRNGSKNLFLGAYSSSKDTSITNVVALGHGTQAKHSNRIYIGNPNHTHLYTPAKIVAQGGMEVNDSSTNAPLTINSNSGGIVFPRMTSAERSAISNPVAGTYVFQTDGTSGLYQYNGASWAAVVAGSGTAMVQTLSLSGTTLSLTNGGSVTLPGAEELNDLSDAYRNINDIGIGTGVFASVTSSGQYNVALGSNALNKLTTAHTNTAVGYLAGKSITTGSGNTVIGSFSQTGLTTGGWNVSLGRGSLEQNIVGSSNTGIGSYALEKTKGNSNVGVGSGALSANINGSNNTAIGKNANVTSTNLNNTTAIGYGALVSTSNTIQLGNNSITTVSTAGNYEGTGLTATNNSTAGGSAIVEMNSTTKGMLMPRMTQTQRKAIGSPVTGLMVYQTDNTQQGVHFYDGSSWRYLGVGVSSN